MEREIIQATEFDIGPLCDEYYWEGVELEIYDEYFDKNDNPIKHHFSNNFVYVTDEVVSYSLEESYEKIKTIVKRVSDDKYFEISWSKHLDNRDTYNQELIEVFPRQIIEVIYE